MDELMVNVQEAIEACLSVDVEPYDLTKEAQVIEVAV